MDLPDGKALDELRALSARLLGSAFRAELGIAVGDESRVSKKDLQIMFRLNMQNPPSETTINNEVDVLVHAKLLQPEASQPRVGKKYWVPDGSSVYWSFCRELADAASGTRSK